MSPGDRARYIYRDWGALHLSVNPLHGEDEPPPFPAPRDEIYLVIERSPHDDRVVKVLTSAGIGWTHDGLLEVVP